jgi:hypothetical protein
VMQLDTSFYFIVVCLESCCLFAQVMARKAAATSELWVLISFVVCVKDGGNMLVHAYAI